MNIVNALAQVAPIILLIVLGMVFSGSCRATFYAAGNSGSGF